MLFVGGTPRLIAGLTYRNARTATAEDFARAKVADKTLAPTPRPPQFPPASPPAPQQIPPALLHAVYQVVGEPTVALKHPDTALKVMKRRWKNADVYLLFNEGAAVLEDDATFATQGYKVQQWNPQTGRIEARAASQSAGHLTVRLRMKPYATRVFVIQRG